MESKAQYHLIVFGATSFVGQILTRYLATQYGVGGDLKWAIAGRSERKLQEVRGSLEPVLKDKAKELPIIIADAANEDELRAMCDQTRAVVSTVGPYALYGEPLVKICAISGTDYCDLTGEPQWIRRMLDKYEAAAQASGARIVHCCGFDSVPSDMGVYFLQQEAQKRFGRSANRVKMRFKAGKGGVSGGTVASMLELTKEMVANPALRKELANPYSLCPTGHGFSARQASMNGVSKDTDMVSYTAPFIMAAINTRVVHRSNALRDKLYGSDFTYDEAVLTGDGAKGLIGASVYAFFLGAFMVLAAIKPTRWLLEKTILPKPGEGPSPKAQEEGFYDLRFIGRTSANETIITRVTGDKDPGYGSTGKMLGEAIVSLACDLHDENGGKKDRKGGFWTPASVFDERYLDRLQDKAGLTFETLS
ncbi:saccharopine dehydrogenase family protein [Thalassolituus sp. LLYu03]|uniref:saccharopine dehydrogenase family protein n=1 Tax=Thalassolituus sp. LLYu03 TaxID=3421656 RepID=UPI003D277537